MDKLNKDGQTLEEFLEAEAEIDYPKASLTTDVILFSALNEKLVALLIKRGNHPEIGKWALPGGFVNENESCEDAAERELFEETGLSGLDLEQLVTVSTPCRDARGWSVTNCFMAVIENPEMAQAADDAEGAEWFSVDYAAKDDKYEMVLKNTDGSIVLRAEMTVIRTESGRIDLNRSTIDYCEDIAFDHAKILLYAIEKL